MVYAPRVKINSGLIMFNPKNPSHHPSQYVLLVVLASGIPERPQRPGHPPGGALVPTPHRGA